MDTARKGSAASAVSDAPRSGGHDIVRVPVTMHWLWAPFGLLLALPVPVLLGSIAISEDDFRLLFNQPLFLDESTRAIAMTYLAIMLAVAAVAVPMRARSAAAIELDSRARIWLDRSVRTLSFVTFGGYAVWFAAAFARGLGIGTIASLVNGDPGAMYVLRNHYFETLGGITTWMQLGALVVPLALLRSRSGGRRARPIVTSLLLLSLARATLNSERLALIEIVASLVLASLILRPQAPRITRRWATAVLLIIGGWFLLFAVFSAFEFIRSWSTARTSGVEFLPYVSSLLFGYYATALNLAAFDADILQGQILPTELFDGNIFTQLFGTSPIAGAQVAYGLATYTNRSGLLVPFVALGAAGGAILILALALTITTLARRTAGGHIVSFAIYCATAVGILEIVRILYFGSSRLIPVIVASFVLYATWKLSRSRASHAPLTRRRP